MSVVATAALLVAIGLLVLAAAACVVQMTAIQDPRARRLAHLYLDLLSVWCMSAVVVHALAVIAAGDIVALELVLPIGIGVAAFLLRWADEPHEAATSEATGAGAPAGRVARTPAAAAGRVAPNPAAPAGRAVPTSATPAGRVAPTPAAAAGRAFAASSPRTPSPDAARGPVRPASGSLWSRS